MRLRVGFAYGDDGGDMPATGVMPFLLPFPPSLRSIPPELLLPPASSPSFPPQFSLWRLLHPPWRRLTCHRGDFRRRAFCRFLSSLLSPISTSPGLLHPLLDPDPYLLPLFLSPPARSPFLFVVEAKSLTHSC